MTCALRACPVRAIADSIWTDGACEMNNADLA